MAKSKQRGWGWIAVIVVVLAVGLGLLENKLWREQNQPEWMRQPGEKEFKYLSIGTERDTGLPYWVFYVLPSMFPERLPDKKSAYGSFGLPWEETVELPAGLTKVTIGYPRVGFNCAVCHSARLTGPPGPPVSPTRSADSTAVAALSRFLYDCATDPRFDGDNVVAEISNFKKLNWIDDLLYRFYIIPATRSKILDGGPNFLLGYREQPTKANGDQGHGYAARLPESERQKLIAFVKKL